MGSSASTDRQTYHYPTTSLTGGGVGALMREIGMAIIPVHMKQSYESIMQIVETAMKLRQFDEAPYNNNLIMLIALLRNAQMEPYTAEPCLPLQGAGGDLPGVGGWEADLRAEERFQRDRVFGRYATSIFRASWNMTAAGQASCMGVEEEDVLFSWFNDDSDNHCPKFMLFLDHDTASVVLVIRGTFSFKDALMDVVCEESEFLDGFAHKGFIDGSRKVMDKCSNVIEKALVDNFGYQLVVCGHSMGGSVAAMITLELLRSTRYPVLPPGITARCVALGSAPVYRTEGDLSQEYLEKIDVYVNDKDVVPRISLGSVAKLLAMLREVDGLGLSRDEQLGVVMWREEDAVVMNRERLSRAVKGVRQERFCYLQHPGRVTRLTNKGGRVEVRGEGVESARDIAENMEISETMITYHLPPAYKETFSKEIYQADMRELVD